MAAYASAFDYDIRENKHWRLDRLFWGIFSYLDFDNKDIMALYVNFPLYPGCEKLQRRCKMYEYSEVMFGKNINELNDDELLALFQKGK